MREEIKLLQGYCGCMFDPNKIIYITEKDRLFMEFDACTGEIKVLDKDNLKGRIRNIIAIEDTLYMVSADGRWIAETKYEQTDFSYYDVEKYLNDAEKLLCVQNYYGKIFLFYKDTYRIIVFDSENKTFETFYMDRAEELKGVEIDAMCKYQGRLCMFSSKQQLRIIYSMGKREIIDISAIDKIPSIQCALYEEGELYLLAENTIYLMQDSLKPLKKMETDTKIKKMCIVNQVMWLFPGEGTDIFCFSLEKDTVEKYDAYPKDFEYDANKKFKYLTRCSSREKVFWMMHSSNYFLSIDRENKTVEWIKPKLINKNFLIEKLSGKRIINEKEFSLEEYISFLNK